MDEFGRQTEAGEAGKCLFVAVFLTLRASAEAGAAEVPVNTMRYDEAAALTLGDVSPVFAAVTKVLGEPVYRILRSFVLRIERHFWRSGPLGSS